MTRMPGTEDDAAPKLVTTITHPQLVAALVKKPQAILDTLSIFTVDCLHAAVGISGEAGELLEAIMFPPTVRNVNMPNGLEAQIDRINLREELGDLYFYIEQLVQRTGIKIDWTSVYTVAANNHLNPDLAMMYAASIAVHASQVLDSVKKAAIYNKPLDLELVTNQVSALVVAMVTLGIMFGVDKPSALAANVEKLSKRYESLSYSDQAALDRADKVQPPEGVIPTRKYFSGEPPAFPDESSDVVQPHTGRTNEQLLDSTGDGEYPQT